MSSSTLTAPPRPTTNVEHALAHIARQVNEHHDICASAAKTALDAALFCGARLAEAKRLVPHGEWGEWLKQNFTGSKRTAQAYMRLHKNSERLPKLGQKRSLPALLTIEEALESIAEPRADAPADGGDEQTVGDDGESTRPVQAQRPRPTKRERGVATVLDAYRSLDATGKQAVIEELVAPSRGVERRFDDAADLTGLPKLLHYAESIAAELAKPERERSRHHLYEDLAVIVAEIKAMEGKL